MRLRTSRLRNTCFPAPNSRAAFKSARSAHAAVAGPCRPPLTCRSSWQCGWRTRTAQQVSGCASEETLRTSGWVSSRVCTTHALSCAARGHVATAARRAGCRTASRREMRPACRRAGTVRPRRFSAEPKPGRDSLSAIVVQRTRRRLRLRRHNQQNTRSPAPNSQAAARPHTQRKRRGPASSRPPLTCRSSWRRGWRATAVQLASNARHEQT